MFTNYFIPAHPDLAPFVDNYIVCTSRDNTITISGGYLPASSETSMVFYLAGRPQSHITEYADSRMGNKSNYLIGLLTRRNGIIDFTGKYYTFTIQFKANGFAKIFRISMQELRDKIPAIEDIVGRRINDLHEHLLNATSIQQMAYFADGLLISLLNRHKKAKPLHDNITAILNELYNTTTLLSVAQYAHKANMSVRNFERKFIEQAGISPKLYIKLVRFDEVLKIKTIQPYKNWTSIAYECGYFDQMHLIKDFKQLTGLSPMDFFKQIVISNHENINDSTRKSSPVHRLYSDLVKTESIFVSRTGF